MFTEHGADLAKGVTSGYIPLGGVSLAPSVHEPLSADSTTMLMHGYTYSEHATACAAALACSDITEREGLLQRATEIGKRLSEGLQGLSEDGLVAEVPGAGAMWAVQLHPGVDAVAVRDRVLDAGSSSARSAPRWRCAHRSSSPTRTSILF